jgi:hypothetical protein
LGRADLASSDNLDRPAASSMLTHPTSVNSKAATAKVRREKIGGVTVSDIETSF